MPLDLHSLARVGAASRLSAIDAERTAILKSFPDLGRGMRKAAVASAAPKQKRNLSPAARAAIRAALKRRWDAWRKAKNG